MTNEKKMTTVSVWTETKNALDEIKVHHQQSYDDLILLLIRDHKQHKEEDENQDQAIIN